MDPLSRLSDAAREMRREVTRRRVAAAFAVPDAEARAVVGEKLAGAVAKHREMVGAETWARFEVALAEAVATGECEALTDAIDALEAERAHASLK
jgi:hypothetical protein